MEVRLFELLRVEAANMFSIVCDVLIQVVTRRRASLRRIGAGELGATPPSVRRTGRAGRQRCSGHGRRRRARSLVGVAGGPAPKRKRGRRREDGRAEFGRM